MGLEAALALEAMLERLQRGEVRAVARAISVVERGGAEADLLLAACTRMAGERLAEKKQKQIPFGNDNQKGDGYQIAGLRIGVTGAPGAGKSSLVDQMCRLLRAGGHTVGVVAVDPSSPFTGGALLGDRIRMQGFSGDDGVLIRSMASRGVTGGVGRAAEGACLVMEAAGRDVVVLETVGVGQDEVGVAGLVDVVVLVLVPGMGDEVQALKAGVMEVADVFCVNKADRGGAELVEAEILGMQGLVAGGRVVPVVKTVGTTGEGVGELLEVVKRVAGEKRGGGNELLAQRWREAGRGRKSIPQGLKSGSLATLNAKAETLAYLEAKTKPGLGTAASFAGLGLDHLGIAVKGIDAARGFYEGLGLTVDGVETVEHEGVRVAMISLGESRIELLEALAEDTVIGRFVAKRGEGLHHVALRVVGIDALFDRLKERGVRLVSDQVRVGAGGHRYFFVHPASTGGVLMEMVEGGN